MTNGEEQVFWMRVANLYMEQANAALERAKEVATEARREETAKDVRWLNTKRMNLDAS